MADDPTTETPQKAARKPREVAPEADSAGNLPANKELTERFLKLSGFKEEQILGSNQARKAFVTTGGGKYALIKNGKAIRVLQGPPTPNQLKEAAEAEEDDDE